ncbi:MAG: proline dehydrogenase family protein [Nitrososphaerota archaeon]|nr:proline dehydrogenase family protein [Nitrososphaerota archaeon]
MTGFSHRLARQWIAGETIADGIERTREANTRGFLGLLNLLGEHAREKEHIDSTVKEYAKLLEQISESKVNSQISIKPTQFGMSLDDDLCITNYVSVAETCHSFDNWLWIDMEDSAFTEKTIALYKNVLSNYPNTGIAIQSCLRRSSSDVKELTGLGAKIRLVKGAYNESPEIAFRQKRLVSENYSKIMRMLFEGGNFFAVATHDGRLISEAKTLSKEFNSSFEFEMLLGVRDKLKTELVSDGYPVREYIPYGPQWFPYSMRRLREKKSNILLLARSLFS